MVEQSPVEPLLPPDEVDPLVEPELVDPDPLVDPLVELVDPELDDPELLPDPELEEPDPLVDPDPLEPLPFQPVPLSFEQPDDAHRATNGGTQSNDHFTRMNPPPTPPPSTPPSPLPCHLTRAGTSGDRRNMCSNLVTR
jgi:hypothetical protein